MDWNSKLLTILHFIEQWWLDFTIVYNLLSKIKILSHKTKKNKNEFSNSTDTFKLFDKRKLKKTIKLYHQYIIQTR